MGVIDFRPQVVDLNCVISSDIRNLVWFEVLDKILTIGRELAWE